MSTPRTPMSGSLRSLWADASVVGPLESQAVVEATLVLRRRAEPDDAAFAGAALARDQLAERYGADPVDVDAVTSTVAAAGAEVVSADPATRQVVVRGAASIVGELFGTTLREVRWAGNGSRQRADGGSARQPSDELTLPAALSGVVDAVVGLDDRPQANVRYRSAAAAADAVSYTPPQLATAYGFPDGDGTGQTIAIVELGGGFGQADLDTYFTGLQLDSPDVKAVSVDGAKNEPGKDPNGADGEVLLDIEVAGAIAPKSAQLVYFAPNTDAGFLHAITQAAHATPAPTAMSISWGQSEDQWSAQSRTAMDQAIADATLLGVTVTAAAGDDGSADRQSGAAPHADFPASSPHVLGCGGTTLRLDSSNKITSETVWNDGGSGGSTGGGVSDAFALPDFQAEAGVPVRDVSGGKSGRGVPDVAAVADPQTGYQVVVDGNSTVIGGTSAVAPLWAGLICRLAQAAGKSLGLIHPSIYAGAANGKAAPGFRDITEGDNGAYSARTGWDACTGLGVPDNDVSAVVGNASAG